MIEDERLEKLIVHNKREYSEETRNKMSEALKGNKRWLGKHHTEETKRKISESQKKRLSH
jgi:lysyl-tRNA synthetase class I